MKCIERFNLLCCMSLDSIRTYYYYLATFRQLKVIFYYAFRDLNINKTVNARICLTVAITSKSKIPYGYIFYEFIKGIHSYEVYVGIY